MAIPLIDLSNVVKWISGGGSGTPTDPYTLALGAPSFPNVAQLTYAAISENASGDRTIIAGTAAQTIRIYGLVINYAASPVTLLVKNGASTTLMTQPLNTYGALVLFSPWIEPLFVLSAANAFVLNLSAGVQVYGGVWYTKS